MIVFGPALRKFEPLAFYDPQLDCLEVITVDCSVTEVSISSSGLVLLERNRPEDGDLLYVGFRIEGVRYFCKENGLPYFGKIKIAEIIERMSKTDKASMPAIVDIALPMLEDYGIQEVEFPLV